MNKIYQSLRLFTNFFLPVMQLTHKTRQGAKVTRSYDTPCSPYERILASLCITEEAKEALRAQEQHLDPVALHERILADERHLREAVVLAVVWHFRRHRPRFASCRSANSGNLCYYVTWSRPLQQPPPKRA